MIASTFTLYLCNLFDTINQLKYVPINKPIAVQPAPARPVQYASPGKPIKSHPDISDASALNAATQGPKVLPPKKYSLVPLFALLVK